MSSITIESAYGLSPLQGGMLFHALYGATAGLYVAQSTWSVEGPLDIRTLRAAWSATIARHAALRTSFHWQQIEKPLQVVTRHSDAPWEEHDWRGASADERAARLRAYLDGDLRTGFDLTRPPLARCALFRTDVEQHVLALTTHHLVLDGWSKRIVLNDLLQIYDAFSRGLEPTLPPSPPFRDYIRWLAAQDLPRAEAYWRRTLERRPVTRISPAQAVWGPGHSACDATIELSQADSDAIREAARRERVTVNTLGVGALALLLADRCRCRDVLFGVTVSGRPPELPDVERRVGMFINTVPARIVVPSGAPSGDWLRAIQRDQAEARLYEYTPLSALQGWCNVPAGETLFDTLFVFQNYPTAVRAVGSVKVVPTWGRQSASYPLVIIVSPKERVQVKAVYDASRFNRAAVDRLLTDYGRVLHQLAVPSRLPLRDDEGSFRSMPAAPARPPAGRRESATRAGLAAAIDREAALSGSRTAIVCRTERLTYANVRDRANRLANLLRKHGVTHEACVLVALEQTPDLVVAPFAIWKAGGVYVPVDPRYPRARIAYMIEDCRPRVVLTQQSLQSALPAMAADVICLDSVAAALDREPPIAEPAAIDPDHLAYVTYTSGSTGLPKGVAVPFRGLANLAVAQRRLGVTPDDCVLQSSSPGFDGCLFNISLAFANGASLVLASGEGSLFGAELVRLITAGEVTVAQMSPTMLAAVPRDALPHLRVVIAAGEACSLELARHWSQGRTFWNLYGPTEYTIWATAAACTPEMVDVSIGTPIPGTRAYVLATDFAPAMAGSAGELYLSGVGTARGYIGRPALTAERFLPDPFSPTPGRRMYRTGDRAACRADGVLQFIGRVDHQVKLRGYRIELGEIETVLQRHPLVDTAVAVLRGTGDAACVFAYVTARTHSLDGGTLRDWLAHRLPHYMVPAAIGVVPGWPLNPNGKLDRSKLPNLIVDRVVSRNRDIAAATELEQGIAGIWRQVLGLDRVGLDSNFFDLGGNSVLALRAYSRLREAFDPELPLVSLFQYPTIRSLAVHVIGRRQRAARGEVAAASPRSAARVRLRGTNADDAVAKSDA
jgi:amino acid adenylation domain-containing protein